MQEWWEDMYHMGIGGVHEFSLSYAKESWEIWLVVKHYPSTIWPPPPLRAHDYQGIWKDFQVRVSLLWIPSYTVKTLGIHHLRQPSNLWILDYSIRRGISVFPK